MGDDRVCLVLGDNIFYAPTLGATLKKAAASPAAATVFGYYVEDPALWRGGVRQEWKGHFH